MVMRLRRNVFRRCAASCPFPHPDPNACYQIGKAWDICLSYYKDPEAAEEGYRRPAQGYGYEFEFDEDDDIPMDAEMAEEFLRCVSS
jgi:hypothetical protein